MREYESIILLAPPSKWRKEIEIGLRAANYPLEVAEDIHQALMLIRTKDPYLIFSRMAHDFQVDLAKSFRNISHRPCIQLCVTETERKAAELRSHGVRHTICSDGAEDVEAMLESIPHWMTFNFQDRMMNQSLETLCLEHQDRESSRQTFGPLEMQFENLRGLVSQLVGFKESKLMAQFGLSDVKLEEFTLKEREILPMLAEFKSNKEIAGELHNSERTIENHVANMIQKSGARNRAALAFSAIVENLGQE